MSAMLKLTHLEFTVNEEIRLLRRGVIVSLLSIIIVSFYTTMLACGYRIELELGRSLEPLLGKYAILLVQYDPPEYREGDIVTVIGASDEGISSFRKILSEIVVYPYPITMEFSKVYAGEMCFVHLKTPQGDFGWYPSSSLRAKVVAVIFPGFR